jgi:hypothetical protein
MHTLRGSLLGFGVTLALCGLAACGDVNMRDGSQAWSAYCQDRSGSYHFKAQVPPWTFNKEYRCTQMQGRSCVGTWQATGRYVFVVSDIPFVNLDSEIVTLLSVEILSGATANLAQRLIIDKNIGQGGSDAEFYDDQSYPRAIDEEPPALSGHDVLWRQNREFEGRSYKWYRRDVFLQAPGSRVYHLELYSIGSMDKPEFDAIIESFREGAAPDGAPDCQCRDEHDPTGPSDC